MSAGENVKGLGAPANYAIHREFSRFGGSIAQTSSMITSSSDSAAQQSVTIGFQITFMGTQEEINTAIIQTTGFTLVADTLNLTDYASNLPQGVDAVGDRVDASNAALATVDKRQPRLTVVAGNYGNAVSDSTKLVYTASFTVTAPADTPIIGLESVDSYKVLRIARPRNPGDLGSPFEFDNAIITALGSGDQNQAEFEVTATFDDLQTVQETQGFTLARLNDLRVRSGLLAWVSGRGRLDENDAAIAHVGLVSVVCSPFYPNIGQQDIFLRIANEAAIDLNELTLTQGVVGTTRTTIFNNTAADTATVARLGRTADDFEIFKVSLGSEITDDAPITVSYMYEGGDRTLQTDCAIDDLADLSDSDADGVNDIVDNNPYDATVTSVNNAIATASLYEAPASRDTFYNRRVLVRSLLRGDEFTYIEAGEKKSAGGVALTVAEYFGIDYATNTKLLEVASGSFCELMLAAARDSQLSQVKLDEICASEEIGAAEDYDFVANAPGVSHRYIWVGVDDDGYLQPSEYPDHTITVLPEINIAGQSSYFYDKETTKTVVISGYAPNTDDTSVAVAMKDTVVSRGIINDETIVLRKGAGEVLFSTEKFLTAYQQHPQGGQTFRRWLTGSDTIWHAAEATVAPISGGHGTFDNAQYAIGADSYVDVRMAQDGSTEPITEIHQLVLYDVTETTVSRVTSAIKGRAYYLVADLTTNIENVGDETVVANQMAGYTIITTDTVVIRDIGNTGHLIEQESFELIAFRVNSDAGDTIAVGWDKIGTAENVLATYRVTEDRPAGYNRPSITDDSANGDADGDRIRNVLDAYTTNNERLQVNVGSFVRPATDYLTTTIEQPLYASDEGLLIAAAAGDDAQSDYSVANIAYRGLTTDTRAQLGIRSDSSITSLATFGIRSVDYGFSQENDAAAASVAGGVAYAVFPLAQSSAPAGEVFYISRYQEDIQQWERFERGTHIGGSADTWYVIDRESPDTEACPTAIELYKGTHEAVGDEGIGFTADSEKCVMVAISDGGPYDNSGVDGRIDALLAMGTELPSRGMQCAAFYPNVGQAELFFTLGDVGFNPSGFEINGSAIPAASVREINAAGTESVLRVALGSEIVSAADITVSYTADGEAAETINRMCVADFKRDSDGDGVADIADNNPFDAKDETLNQNVVSASLATTPASTDTFYNRRVLVRSLLRGNEFTYVENGEFKTGGGAALSAADYFGIDYAADTKLLSVQNGSDCAAILAVARTNRLSKVKLNEFCADDLGAAESYDFPNEVSTDRERRYVWVGVNNEGYLVPSAYPDHTIYALSEINISGQSSYFYAEPPEAPALPTNIIISAYAPDDTNTPIDLTIKGTVVSGAPIADEVVTLSRGGGPDAEVYSQLYFVAGNNNNPQAGQTIRRWLTAGSSNVWQPGEATVAPIRGGYESFNDMQYAIGDHSYVDVRVAKDGDAEPIAQINQLLLYDVTVTTVSRVTSVIQGRTYYLVADVTTNIEDIGDETVLNITERDGWEELSTQHVILREKISDTGHLLSEESFEIIAFLVNSGADVGDTITVGWDRIGTAENVLATYRVTDGIPAGYDRPGTAADDNANGDRDGDRIRNALDLASNSPRSLQVAVDGTINAPIDLLRWYGEPFYVSDEGLLIAAAEGDDMTIDYSAANIAYSDLSDETKAQLGIMDDATITSLATFGVRSVDYGFSQGNADTDARLMGGVAYAVFPLSQASVSDEVFYISRYNDEDGRWERIERGTRRSSPADTWYVIDKESFLPCALDPEIYRNKHRAVGDEGMGFTANNQKCVLVAMTDGGSYDSSGVDGRVDALLAMGTKLQPRTQGLQCAAFYPNVGQRELFFELENIDVNTRGFELEQGGNRLNVGSVRQINPDATEEVGPVLRLTLSSEIVSDDPIRVAYTADAETRTINRMCVADFRRDTDRDGVVDIADNNPFDAADETLNQNVVSASLAATPASTDTFYNRRVLVRSLLRGNEFTYVENGDIKTAGGAALSAADYFGIDYAANTKLLRVSGGDCAAILAVARANRLSKVKLNEFCASEDLGAAEDYDFVNEVSETRQQRYVWVGVNNAGYLVPSAYPDHTISALTEINISGQSSYFYAAPPTEPKNIIISAYVPDATNTPIDLTMKGTVVSGDAIDDETVTLTRSAGPQAGVYIGPKVYGGIHPVTGDGKNPQAGQTIRHWLSAGSSNIWQAGEATVVPIIGGHGSFDDAQYAIGDSSYVDVRVAKDGTDEPITEIDYLVLLDVTESPATTASLVTSVVQGRYYYLTAGLTTNIADISTETRVATMAVNGYTIFPAESQAGFETIAFRVTTDTQVISDAGNTITVGWDRIGTAENVLATYRVTETIPAGYNRPGTDDDNANGDRDGDRIRNGLDIDPDNPFSLQVAVDNNIDPFIDWLSVVGWYDQPLYASGQGLIIAAAKGDDMTLDYSAANIDYQSLSADTKTQLGLGDDPSITSLATFGVRSVAYGFSQENDDADAMIVGGVAYAVFPIEAGTSGQALYISRYNDDMDVQRWEHFERGTRRSSPADTWYVIDRESNTFCPLDVGVYRNEHSAAGAGGMGFTANTEKCVLVAITDGGPYDNSGVDGIIDTLLAVGTQLQPRTQGLQCAAFYPNVGQRELFFELENIEVNRSGFVLEQGGNRLTVGSVRQMNGDGADPVLRVALSGEIVSDADITVTYTVGDEEFATRCSSEFGLIANADRDALRDIADNNPFDRDNAEPNRNVVNPTFTDDVETPLVVPDDADFYSREVVVRSLLRDEEFTYIVEDENGQPIRDADTDALQSEKFTSDMTPAQYFGVPAAARVYKYSAECRSVLAAARTYGLTQVRIDGFCTDITDNFVNAVNQDFVEDGRGQYIWATVRGGGFLLSSYIGDAVKILPEINFVGQSSYLLIEPAVKTVDISAYVGGSAQESIPGLLVKNTTTDTTYTVELTGIDSRLKKTQYDLASPQPGETITSWLSGSSAIWQPNSETLMTTAGGHDATLISYDYAIGTHNIVSVRAADPANESEQITEIRQVLLYKVPDDMSTTPTRVKSMVTGESYYLAVDFDTNIRDIESQIEAATEATEGIVLDELAVKRTTATDVISLVERAGHLEKAEVDILEITIGNANGTTETGVITVGWDTVGSVVDVISRYLVTTIEPRDYALADADLDGIPDRDNNDVVVDNHPTDNSRLQVSIGDTQIDPVRDYLTTQDGNPTFFTHEGLVIANALNDSVVDDNHYSVVHDAAALDEDTKLLLGIRINDADEIDTIATFGVAGVEYGFEANDDGGATITGGVIYASFPIEVDMSLFGETLYLGKYIGGRWHRFARGTDNTWYAIERPSGAGVAGACPTAVQIYENEHEAVGTEDMGFTAHPDGNCIMVVITDGERYDTGSSLDGRVIDPLSIGTKLFGITRVVPTGGGGGGAIGVSDILLLIGALVLITVAGRKRRRIY